MPEITSQWDFYPLVEYKEYLDYKTEKLGRIMARISTEDPKCQPPTVTTLDKKLLMQLN